jgi:DNA-binding MurR/RpiR family transcriptional regulator
MLASLKNEVLEKYGEFSNGLKKVSKYFLTNPEAFALH